MTDTRDDTEKAEDSASAQIIRLSVEDQRALAEAILNPPPPSPALLRAFATHRKLIEESRSREVLGIEDFTESAPKRRSAFVAHTTRRPKPWRHS
jgi:hypothetical protein